MNISLDDPNLYRDLVVLYCPKKVGSTSMVSSIRISATDKFSVFHTHDNIIYKSFSEHKDFTVEDLKMNAENINKFTNKPRKVYIIDIYRNPIERKISEYFEDLGILHFNQIGENLYSYPMIKIAKRFNDIFPWISSIDYFKQNYKIPQPSSFDFENGYIKYEQDNITWIKLRMNDSNKWGEILSRILDTEITIVKDYETDLKPISILYNKFKEEYRLPVNYFRLIESDPEVNFYLTPEEKYKYLNSWVNKLSDEYIGFTRKEYDLYMKITLENQYYDIKKSGHYIDDGCVCTDCKEKRNKYLEIVKNGVSKPDFSIIHSNNEFQTNTFISVNCFYPNGNIIQMLYNIY